MLLKKMLRDMLINKTQFISIFIMVILGVYIYAGVSSEWNGMQKTINCFYKETNLADAWVYSQGFSEEEAKAIEDFGGVTGVERRLTIDSIAGLKNSPTIRLHFVEKYQISTFHLVEGEKFSPSGDGIWLDSLFAKAVGLKTGDMLKVTVNGVELKQTIKGLIMSPEYVYSSFEDDFIQNRNNYGYAYLSYQALPKEIPAVYTDLLITADKSIASGLENKVDQALNGKYGVFISRKNMRSYMQFSEEIKEHKAMGQIFPIAFLAVAMLTTVTTMARLVNNQRTQIGILKAIGFKRKKILFHYISYGLWLGLAGSIVGIILGPLTLPYLFYGPMQTVYTLPEWKSQVPFSVIFIAAFSVIGCTLVTYLACRSVLKDTPSESMRPKAPKDIKHSFIDRIKLWNRLNFHTQWNLRDVIRYKVRSIMAIVGVMGCSALLICAFGMQDTFQYLVKWNYGELNRYKTRLELEDQIPQEQLDHIIEEYNGEAIFEGSVELKVKGRKKSGEMLVMDDVSLIHFVDSERKEISLPKNQISISYKMAENLKVKEGDRISWHIYGEEKWNNAVIGAIYRTPLAQGITMSRECYEKYGYSFTPSAVLTGKDLSGHLPKEGVKGIEKVRTKADMIESYNTLSEAMNTMIFVLILAAVILGAVVIYNLGVLAFTERQRELSTLKVMGFKTKKLRTLLLTQNIWLTLVGILPGILIGIRMLRYIFQFVGNVFDFIIIIYAPSYVYCAVGTLLVSVIVNRLFSKRVKNIDMVSSLKGVE